jgi:hypothetical protein
MSEQKAQCVSAHISKIAQIQGIFILIVVSRTVDTRTPGSDAKLVVSPTMEEERLIRQLVSSRERFLHTSPEEG